MGITYQQMPVSFVAQGLLWGATEGGLYRVKDGYCVGGMKVIARLIYQLVVAALLAPLGVLYHTCKALYHMVLSYKGSAVERARHEQIAWEHLKALGVDALGGITLGNRFFLFPRFLADEFFTSTAVQHGVPDLASIPVRLIDRQARGFFYHGLLVRKECRMDLLVDEMLLRGSCEIGPDLLKDVAKKACDGHEEIPDLFRWRTVFYPELLESLETGVKGTRRPEYTFPWTTLAYVVASLALCALGAWSYSRALELGLESTSWTAKRYIWGMAGSVVGAAFLLLPAKSNYIRNRAEAEIACGTACTSREESFYWYNKALLRGYAEAQYNYGRALLEIEAEKVSDNLLERGETKARHLSRNPTAKSRIAWDWLHLAALNGSEHAKTWFGSYCTPGISTGRVGEAF